MFDAWSDFKATPLPYLHLFTPCLLFIPLLTLLPLPPSPPPEIPGIRPITIRRVTPRRGLILTLLVLLALTSFLDGVVLVVDFLGAPSRGEPDEFEGLNLAAWVIYAVGGLVIWSMTAIVTEWRARWDDRGVVMLGTLAIICEIPNMVFLALRTVPAVESWQTFTILSIPPSGLRLLLLPILLAAVSNPKISYEPADETTGLLIGEDGSDDAESSANAREAYGTFGNRMDAPKAGSTAASESSQPNSAVPPTGANTPAVNKGPIKIPKQLGEIKKEDKPLKWKEIWARIVVLSPNLWPSTNRRLQMHVVFCVFIIIAGRILQPMLPLSLGAVVRALTQNEQGRHGKSPWSPFIAYFAIRVTVSGSGLLYFVQQRLWIPISQYTDREMMMTCFNHLLNLSLAYHTKRNTGEVLKVIDRGSAINNLFQTVLFTAVPTLFDIVIAFGIFFYLYGGLLAGMTFAVMALYLYVSVWATQRRVITRRLLMEKDVKQRGIISDVLMNWESVKYFTAEQRESNRFREAIVSYQDTEKKWSIDWQLLYLVQTFLLALGLMAGSLLISYRVLDGTSDAAEFVVFLQYFQQLSSPLDRLGFLYQQLNRNSIDAEKMFTLLNEATEVNDKPGAKDLVVTDGIVEFDNVQFSYDGKVQALKGVSFKVDKGQSMALIGESGSGKSTILRLLYRFYDIDSGVIRIDGQDISEVTQSSLRRAIGIVPQDSVLWNDTIGANISYGKEGATDEEIIEAAQSAKMHDRILSFTDEYSTIVGERGIRLSGGEKQRVSLARMFLKSPAILVLDEATSALDTETEREIQRALADLAKGRSSLSIAHRLSTIINSDQIVVMKHGQVIENGAYKDLLELDGAFATMWKKQIFTEAEMVAQAQGKTPEEADLIQLEEDIKRDVGHDENDGMLAVQESKATQSPTTPAASPNVSPAIPQKATVPTPASNGKGKESPPSNSPAPSQSQGTPDKRAFPNMSTPQSVTHESDDVESGASTPVSGSASAADLSMTNPGPEEVKGDKRRKRLSSLKRFVRRISDQGVSRNPSIGKGSTTKSPMGELDEEAAMGASTGGGGVGGEKRKVSIKGKQS